MTNSARRSSHPGAPRHGAPRAILGLLALTAALLALCASSAQALVSTVETTTVGLAPRISTGYVSGAKPSTFANASGNPVLHGADSYAIYWDPTDHYWSEWQNVIDTYLQNAGAESGSLSSLFADDAQYTDKSNKPAYYAQTFKGAYTDTHAYPASGCTDPNPFELVDRIGREFGGAPAAICLTSAEVATELEAFIAAHGLPKGLGTEYYLLTPPGVTVCLTALTGAEAHCSDYEGAKESQSYDNSFCSYHAAINPGNLPSGSAETVVYAVIPWTAGTYGDYKIHGAGDYRPGWECQDGGINPAGKHGDYEEEKAEKTERTQKQQEEFEAKTPEEQAEVIEAEELKGPHEEEPNQEKCPNTDGSCDRGLADLIIGQVNLEQQDMITDPLLNAWKDSKSYEVSDECRFLFGPVQGGSVSALEGSKAGTLYDQVYGSGTYYLNDTFNLAAERLPYPGVACIHGANLDPKFTAPNTVNSGETVAFDGMESDITMDAAVRYSASGSPEPNYATYTWNFGDGSPEVSGYAPGAPACELPWLSPCAASVLHSYQYGGTYVVTLKVTDVAGNVAIVTHEVRVDGPAAPGSGNGSGGSGGSSGSGSGGSSSAGGSTTTGATTTTVAPAAVPVPAPVAADAVISHNLGSLAKTGVVVRYSVNEQVAGRFEVLIASSLAHRLKISGAPALGLPAGTPPELVIAKAVVVTTSAGRSAVKLLFSKRTAARLAHQRKVSLMLRLLLRNAATGTPTTTSVLSAFTLYR